MRRPKEKTKPETKVRALSEVVDGVYYTEIAEKFGFSVTTISQWAKAAGLPRRKKGRAPDPNRKPTSRVQEILQSVADKGCSATAREFGLARQRVSFLHNNWKIRGWQAKPSWPPGSWVKRGRQSYVVVEVCDVDRGRVMDEDGTVLNDFRWRMGRLWTIAEDARKRPGRLKADRRKNWKISRPVLVMSLGTLIKSGRARETGILPDEFVPHHYVSESYWIHTCDCGIPDCAGVEHPVTVVHQGGLTLWKVASMKPKRICVFDTHQQREAILDGVRRALELFEAPDSDYRSFAYLTDPADLRKALYFAEGRERDGW